VLYGLPSEIDAATAAQERRRGRRGARRRKALAAGVVALLLTGGVTGAYAVQQRSAEEGPATQAVLDVSREALILAAEVDEALLALEESVAVAREVYDTSAEILSDDDDAADLRAALDDA